MKYCPNCLRRGNKHKDLLQYAKIEGGIWVYYQKCAICGAEFDEETGKDAEGLNPFKEDKE